MNPLFEQVDRQFREYLRVLGKPRGTRNRAMVLQAFLQNTKPVTARDVHYQVKAMNHNVSWHSVYATLALLVQSGLAKEIISDDGSARLYTHELAIAQCSHTHLICKDCGAIIKHTHKEEYAEEITEGAPSSAPDHRQVVNRFILQ